MKGRPLPHRPRPPLSHVFRMAAALVHRSEDMPPARSMPTKHITVAYTDEPDAAACPSGRILLHSCCAPCSGAMFTGFLERGLDVVVFFYNPNIHPVSEYEVRKNENKRFCASRGVQFVDCDYDARAWFERTRGLEYEPERGSRCTACFDMRLEVTAAYAAAHGFQTFTTTNAASRWKDLEQVNDAGRRAALPYPGLSYWGGDWQTAEMTALKYKVSAEQRFYKQEYCGCSHSLRDSNAWRALAGLPPCKVAGVFSDPAADAAEESQEVVDAFFRAAARQFDSERLRRSYEARHKDDVSGATGTAGNNW